MTGRSRWVAPNGWAVRIVVLDDDAEYQLTQHGYLTGGGATARERGRLRTLDALKAELTRWDLALGDFTEEPDPS